LKAKLKRNF
jgi:hypothetical protein